MHDMVAVQMMRRCLDTIESQRAQIARLAPKAEAYDRIGALIDMQSGNRNGGLMGASEDVTWQLRREIEETQRRMSVEKSRADTTRTEPVDDREPQEEINHSRSAEIDTGRQRGGFGHSDAEHDGEFG